MTVVEPDTMIVENRPTAVVDGRKRDQEIPSVTIDRYF